MPLPFTGPLDDSQLDILVQRAKDYNFPMHDLIKKARTHRRMEQEVAMPAGTRKTQIQVRNAFLFDMTQRMTAATIKNWPWIEAVADDITQESERRASKKERHTTGALKRMSLEAGTHQDPFPRVTWGQYGDGMGIYKCYHRPDRWLPWPKRNGDASGYMSALKRFKMSRFPFAWRSVDALTYNPIYGDEGKVFVAEVTRRAVADLEGTFGYHTIKSAMDTIEVGASGYLDEQGTTQIGGTVEFQEIMTLSHIYYRVDGKTIRRVEHHNPFIHYYEARGITTEANIPGKDSLPLTWGLLKYSPLLDTMFTTIAEGFMIAGIPTPFLKTDPNAPEFARLFGPDGRPISQEIALGQINPVQGELTLPLSQAMPAMLNDSLKAIMGLADAVNLPAALRGQGIGSDWSGYLANTVLHVVLTLLAGPLHNHEAAFTQMIRDYWWTIQNKVGEDVWVWHQLRGRRGRWAPLGPDDIRDFYEVYVHLRPSLPRDEVQMAQTGLQIWKAGGIDLRTYLTKWLEEDFPDEIEERIMLERLFNREEIDTIRLTALLRRLAPDSPIVEQILAGLEAPAGGGMEGFPGAQPGMQEAAPFAAGALGPVAGTPQALPSGPQMAP